MCWRASIVSGLLGDFPMFHYYISKQILILIGADTTPLDANLIFFSAMMIETCIVSLEAHTPFVGKQY
jgi:hypothetical protein